jgi:two-component system response regulator DesR
MLRRAAATIRAPGGHSDLTSMNAHPLRVLIAEDNADLRDLLVTLVSAEPDLKCVGTAADVDTVIASTTEHKADVLVLDLELQGRSSIDVLKTVRGAGSKITIIVFSGHAHPEMIRHTLAAGADAYVRKDGDFEVLLDAIRDKRAHRGAVAPGGESGDAVG